MQQVYLGFKAFDLHELACDSVARYAGIYEAHDIQVRLLDTSFIPDDRFPDQTFHAACGSATCSWLAGAPMTIVFTATDKPMFWLYVRPEISSFDELAARRVAGFPGVAPPAKFLRMIIKSVGLDPDSDLSIEAVRDDTARLGLMRSGDVSAAVISAAVLPAEVRRFGFTPLAFFGDELRIPTTGLAVHRAFLDRDPKLVATMSHCYLDSLQLIHEQTDVLHEALREAFAIPRRGSRGGRRFGAELLHQRRHDKSRCDFADVEQPAGRTRRERAIAGATVTGTGRLIKME